MFGVAFAGVCRWRKVAPGTSLSSGIEPPSAGAFVAPQKHSKVTGTPAIMSVLVLYNPTLMKG